MNISFFKKTGLSVSVKTSIMVGIVISILLTGLIFYFLKYQSDIVKFAIDENTNTIERVINEQADIHKNALYDKISVTTKIAGSIAADYLNNFNPEGLIVALQSYMQIAEIEAIVILNTGNEPFVSLWRSPQIASGTKLPGDINLSSMLSFNSDASFENEKVGSIQIYYSDKVIIDNIKKSKKKTQDNVLALRQNIDLRLEKAMITQSTGVIFVILILVFTIIICLKSIVINPILKNVRFTEKMSEGDFSQKIVIDQKDEIGIMGSALNIMVSKIEKMFSEIVQGIETLSASSSNLSQISKYMHQGAQNISVKSKAGSSLTKNMEANINSVAYISRQTADNVKMVSVATAEMNTTISQIGQNSEKALLVTNKAVLQTQNISEKVNELGNAANEISKVTEIITEISDQTNLLALNATIEAARAGEAGKGFAVVANEIKELARQTANATKEIKSKIGEIQGATSDTVTEIKNISHIIHSINEIITTIASAVEDQAVTTKEISGNINQVSQGINQVDENIDNSSKIAKKVVSEITQIEKYTEDIFDTSSKVNINAEELFVLAKQLKQLVGKFKVPI
ncbi:MAG: HAMP domain-containing protein [Desulfamplus sp.]|nr:HAMP domain-containing protein [Desulfamplus sp.]